MLSIQNLSKTYDNGVRALREVTLEIPNGMFGLLGPNGAGKSSLMRTLATLQSADSGTARLGDIDVLNQKHELRKHLGYLPQGQPERYRRAVRMVAVMEENFGNCTNFGECEAACPKGISIDFIARMNRDFLKAKLTG